MICNKESFYKSQSVILLWPLSRIDQKDLILKILPLWSSYRLYGHNIFSCFLSTGVEKQFDHRFLVITIFQNGEKTQKTKNALSREGSHPNPFFCINVQEQFFEVFLVIHNFFQRFKILIIFLLSIFKKISEKSVKKFWNCFWKCHV